MATSESTDLCDICVIRNKTTNAMKWCPQCEEKLCNECHDHHMASKLSRSHGVMDIQQYRKLPKSVLAVKNICDEHGKTFTNFCQQHDKICCPVCISKSGSHGKCTTSVLEEVIQTAKTSVLLQSVEETLKNHKDNLKKIINNRQSNLKNLQDQKNKILNEVKQIKETLIKHLNDFEKKINDDLDKTVMKNTHTITSEIASFEKDLEQTETMLNEANTVTQHGSDLQIFIGTKSMDKEVTKMNNSVQELVKNETMKQVVVDLKWDTDINQVIEKISSLGSIVETKTPMVVTLASDKGTQVQVMSSQPKIDIEDITLTKKFEFTFGDIVTLRGCSVLQNNKTIFADSRKENIILFKDNGEKEKVIPTSTGPYDVAVIDDNTVAVSTDEGVKVINITTNAVEKTINTGTCYGLEFYKGSLFCCVYGKGVRSVDLSTSSCTTVVQDKTYRGWLYCTVYIDRIYTTLSGNHTVTCYTMGGDKVWEFKDPSVINYPVGIDVDNSSNVYIASCHNHSVVALSPDGQSHRTLLTQKNGIYSPWALYFDRLRNQLLVGNLHGPGLLFSTPYLLTNTRRKIKKKIEDVQLSKTTPDH